MFDGVKRIMNIIYKFYFQNQYSFLCLQEIIWLINVSNELLLSNLQVPVLMMYCAQELETILAAFFIKHIWFNS